MVSDQEDLSSILAVTLKPMVGTLTTPGKSQVVATTFIIHNAAVEICHPAGQDEVILITN